jgi:hypothetical protein
MSEIVLAVLTLAACVYGVSAASKLSGRAAFGSFQAGMRATGLLPERSLRAVTVLLVSAEAAVTAGSAAAAAGLALTPDDSGLLVDLALGVGCILIALLLAGVALVMRWGTQAPCRCFGATSHLPLGAVHLVRNSCLLGILAAGLVSNVLRGPVAATSGPGDVVAAAAGLIGALLFIRWDDLAELVLPMRPPAGRPARMHSQPAGATARAGRTPR